MSLRIDSANPTQLLARIKTAINAHHVETWSCDKDGDFTHVPAQWKDKAWWRPEVKIGFLELRLILPQDVQALDATTLGVYHGRFIEMLMTHFRTELTKASAIP